MLVLSDKWITTKCQPPDLRAWVADRAAVARLGPDNPAAASGTSHHPPPSSRTDRLLLWVLLDQKLTPTPLAAAVVYAPFQVVLVFRQQGVGGPGGVRPATRPGILPRFRHQPGLQGASGSGSLGVRPIWGASGSDRFWGASGEPRGSLGGASGSGSLGVRGASGSDRFRISCGENSKSV